MSKEFKAGDKVRVLVDAPRGQFIKGCIYEVHSVYGEDGRSRITVVADSNGNTNGWLADNFELVESFDDLIDVAIQAVKDEVIVIRRFHSSLLNFEKIGETNHASDVEVTRSSKAGEIQDAIDFIKSLYTETFVIKTRDDIKPRIKAGAKYTHQNGLTGTVISVCYQDAGAITVKFDGIDGEVGAIVDLFSIFTLKGATITQKKDVK